MWQANGIMPDTVTFSILLKSYANAQPVCSDDAQRVLKRMEERGLSPDTITYNTVFKAYGKANSPCVYPACRIGLCFPQASRCICVARGPGTSSNR